MDFLRTHWYADIKKGDIEVGNYVFPRFDSLRWVPMRCRSVLPLHVMKRFRCIVVGIAQKDLTIAITEPVDRTIIVRLHHLTGYTIFPVLITVERMNLLIKRVERDAYNKKMSLYLHYRHHLQIRDLVPVAVLTWRVD